MINNEIHHSAKSRWTNFNNSKNIVALFIVYCISIAEECSADRCSKVPCQHGGKCLTSGETAVCLCPLGFTGDLCETRVDLQVSYCNLPLCVCSCN